MLNIAVPRARLWLNWLAICLGCLVSSSVFAEVLLGTVIAVHDGDSITLRTESNKKKIRLAGIDAPELKQPYGVESRSLLREAVLDKSVLVESSRNDKYRRVIGKVTLDGQDINLKQIQLGGAWVYRAYLKELSKEDRAAYLEAEAESKTIAVGLWKDSNPVEPWIWRGK